MRRVAVLFGSDTPIDLAMMRSAEAVARSLGITIAGVDILDGKIERAIADFGKERDGGLICSAPPPHAGEPGTDHPAGGGESLADGLSIPIICGRCRVARLRARSE